LWQEQTWYAVVLYSVVAGLALGSLAWIVLSWVFVILRLRLWSRETKQDKDLDADRHVGKPPEAQVTLIQLVLDEKGKKSRMIELPIPESKVRQVATACLFNGQRFSRRELSDILSQKEYADLSAAMIAAGLVVDTSTGRELTAAGRAIMRHYT
jgi:hypothetical protein